MEQKRSHFHLLLAEHYKFDSYAKRLYSRSRARTNGATQTFRRPSLATNLSQQREASQMNSTSVAQNAGVYVPPHLNSNYQSGHNRNGGVESRYSKDQLLDLFRSQMTSGPTATNVCELYMEGWNPGVVNGTTNGGWGKRDDHKDGLMGPEICWDYEGKVQPLALVEMNDQEKEVTKFYDCYQKGLLTFEFRLSQPPSILHSSLQLRP